MSRLTDSLDPLAEYDWQGKYTVAFNRYIYDDYKDCGALSAIAAEILSPEKYKKPVGYEYLDGYFVKDGIMVEMHWSSMTDYEWQTETDNRKTQKTVFSWAAAVQKEYLRRNEDMYDIKPLIIRRCPGFTAEFNKYVYDCAEDPALLCETVRSLLAPLEFAAFPSPENMNGYFIKDGIRVEMHGIRVRLYDDKYGLSYFWQADCCDLLEEMIITEWAEHIKNEYPNAKRGAALDGKLSGKPWNADMSAALKNYEPVSAVTDLKGRYVILLENYRRYIYNNVKDCTVFNRIIHDLLRPEAYLWDGEDEISGYFIKDNIKVNTHWSDWTGYEWTVRTDNGEIKRKLLRWALEVNEEYQKLYRKHKRSSDPVQLQ